jgi:hypothetical protein
METLGPDDREHLEKEAEDATAEEKMNMIHQVNMRWMYEL